MSPMVYMQIDYALKITRSNNGYEKRQVQRIAHHKSLLDALMTWMQCSQCKEHLTSGIRAKSSDAGASVEDHTEFGTIQHSYSKAALWIVSAWASAPGAGRCPRLV